VASPGPDDLRAAARVAVGALRPLTAASWAGRAGTLEWDVRTTVAHTADALGFYAVHLAARSAQRLRFDVSAHAGAPNAAVLDVVEAAAETLALVAEHSPADAKGRHGHGMADPAGFVAMGCSELLVHADDALRGLDSQLHPPQELCAAVVDRLYPAATMDAPGWDRLLWATGRLEIAGHGRLGDDWRMHPAPLDG
jgi:hypothetical protein